MKPGDRHGPDGPSRLSHQQPGVGDAPGHGPPLRIVHPNKPGLSGVRPNLGHSDRVRFSERQRAGHLDALTRGDLARKIKLSDQYRMAQQGDFARRLGLNKHSAHSPSAYSYAPAIHGRHRPPGHNWDTPHDFHGRVHPRYVDYSFAFRYYGPSYYPRYCWYPRWSPWVDWSWNYHCQPLWDPRPVYCRPIIYQPAPRWTWWDNPVWVTLPVVTCGTWVDVEPVEVGRQYDLQLLAVRFVEPGHPDERLGPRFRVWLRNNSQEPVTQPFDVLLVAGPDAGLRADLPQAGVRVTSIETGDTQAVDIRLPFEVYQMGQDAEGQPVPYSTLHVLVDANREVPETFESNNGTRIAREDVLPVDPAAFELDRTEAPAGGEVLLAGECFGPEPGKVLVHLGNVEMEGEILGWYELGVRLLLPNLPLAGPTPAELIVIRGDGAAANPLQITITPPADNPEVILVPPGAPQ